MRRPRSGRSARGHRLLAVTLLASMAAAAILQASIGVLAPALMEEFSFGPATLGWIAALMPISAALLAPLLGGAVDRFGYRAVLIGLFLVSATGLWVAASAAGTTGLVVAALVFGVAMAGSNPATNAAIRSECAPGQRGTVTGVKQSGVKASQAFAGFALPALLGVHGLRPVLGVLGALVACGGLLPVVVLRGGRSEVTHRPAQQPSGVPSGWLRPLLLYVVLMATAQGALLTYLPLYAHEVVGFDRRAAGSLLGVVTAVAVLGRVSLSRFVEGADRLRGPLGGLAGAGLVGVVLALAGQAIHPGLLWLAAVVLGASVGTWNAGVQMAVIDRVPTPQQGRASGVLQTSFLAGLGLGPLAYAGAYAVGGHLAGWTVAATCLAAAAARVACRRSWGGPPLSGRP